jgi:hypothetical protein
VVEIHEGVCGPEFIPELFAGYDLAGLSDQYSEDLEGLFLEPYSQPTLTQFASAKIQLENPKTESPVKLIVCPHGKAEPGLREVYHRGSFAEQKSRDNLPQVL